VENYSTTILCTVDARDKKINRRFSSLKTQFLLKKAIDMNKILMYLMICGGGETTWKYCSRYQLQQPFCGSLSGTRETGPECKTTAQVPKKWPEELIHISFGFFISDRKNFLL
jgi:hypothetical protein